MQARMLTGQKFVRAPKNAALIDHLEARLLLGGDPFPNLNLMEDQSNPVIRLETTVGDIHIEVLRNRDASFADAYLSIFSSPERHQTVFHNLIPGVALEAGRWSYLDSNLSAFEFAGTFGNPVSPQPDNLARTVVATSRPALGSPLFSTMFYFNLQDNAPPAPEGEYAVVARVLGDDSWNVVQTIAGLSTADFGDQSPPFPHNDYATPIRAPWTSGDPVPTDLLVQIIDASMVKAAGASDYYRHYVYSAEGFTGSTIDEFVPIENPNDETVHYEIWARYEALPGAAPQDRDQLVSRASLGANSRGGVTISTRGTWASAVVRHGVPYALEIRSTLPIAANLSHYDFGTATGEAFAAEPGEDWTFVGLGELDASNGFLTWYNPSDQPVTVDVTLRASFNDPFMDITVSFTVNPFRRGGLSLSGFNINEYNHTAVIEASAPIVAQLSSYDAAPPQFSTGGYTTLGSTQASTIGVVPIAARLSSNGYPAPLVRLYNPGNVTADVQIDYFLPGSAVPFVSTSRTVQPLELIAEPALFVNGNPTGPLTMVYRSTVPVHGSLQSWREEDRYRTDVATSAATSWHFAEGFTDPARTQINVLEEHVGIFNPNAASFGGSDVDANVELIFRYTDGTTFSVQRTIGAGVGDIIEISVLQEIIDQAEQNARYFYSIEVVSNIPVVAQMIHTDATLGSAANSGGFTTLGTVFGPRTPLDQNG